MDGFTGKSNWRGLLAVGGEYLAIALALWLAHRYPEPWLVALAVGFVGTRQYALAETLTHEAVHGNLCASRRLNDLLGVLTTWPFFYVLSGYRRYHLDHHRVPPDDPDNNIHEQYEDWGLPGAGQPLPARRALWLFVARPLLGLMAVHHVRTIASNVWWDRDLAENRAMLVFWALLAAVAVGAGFGVELLVFWVLPQVLVIGTLDFWSETGDHYRVSGAHTRSDLNPWLNRLLAHNIGYHALHHRYPGIPWFRLPAAYAKLRGGLQEQTSRGYAQTFRQMIAAGQRP